jgi:hypothetical protein
MTDAPATETTAPAAEAAEPEEAPTLTPDKPDDGIIRIEGVRKNIKPFNVELVGVQYRALPMKALVAVSMGKKMQEQGNDINKLMESLGTWVNALFGRKNGPAIMERLTDPADELDLPDVMEVIKQMTKKATANPTL